MRNALIALAAVGLLSVSGSGQTDTPAPAEMTQEPPVLVRRAGRRDRGPCEARARDVQDHRRVTPRQLLAAHDRHHPVGAWPSVQALVGPQRRNDRRPVPGHLAQPGDDLRLHYPRQVGGAGTGPQLVDSEGVQEFPERLHTVVEGEVDHGLPPPDPSGR